MSNELDFNFYIFCVAFVNVCMFVVKSFMMKYHMKPKPIQFLSMAMFYTCTVRYQIG